MKKILVLGPCGSGKSTFARHLSSLLSIEAIHLDQHFFSANWVEASLEEWYQITNQLMAQDSWIMDGNYGSTLDLRLQKAEAVIYLDTSTFTHFFRIIKRLMKYYGRTRPDMKKGCNERFDLSFLHYALVFNYVKRPSILRRVRAVIPPQHFYILKSNKDREAFLSEFTKCSN